jgi:hypothetical protein
VEQGRQAYIDLGNLDEGVQQQPLPTVLQVGYRRASDGWVQAQAQLALSKALIAPQAVDAPPDLKIEGVGRRLHLRKACIKDEAACQVLLSREFLRAHQATVILSRRDRVLTEAEGYEMI